MMYLPPPDGFFSCTLRNRERRGKTIHIAHKSSRWWFLQKNRPSGDESLQLLHVNAVSSIRHRPSSITLKRSSRVTLTNTSCEWKPGLLVFTWIDREASVRMGFPVQHLHAPVCVCVCVLHPTRHCSMIPDGRFDLQQ